MKVKLFLIPVLTIALLSCNQEDVRPTQNPEIALSEGGNLNSVVNRNKQEILDNMDLIGKGLTGLMSNAGFTTLVRQETLLENVDNDLDVTLASLSSNWQSQGFSLKDALSSGILASGGTPQEAEKVKQIVNGFVLEGIRFDPVIHFPQLDAEFFQIAGWDGKTPDWITTSESRSGNGFDAYKSAGVRVKLSPSELANTAGWIVSVARISNPGDPFTYPERPWGKCYCCPDSYGGSGCLSSCTANFVKCARADLWGHCPVDCSRGWSPF